MTEITNDNPSSLLHVESFDADSKVFVGTHPGVKGSYLSALWVGEPLIGVSEGQVITIQSTLSSIYPVDTIIQFGLVCSPDVNDVVFDYLKPKKQASNELVAELVTRHAELMASGTEKPLIKSSGVHLNKKRLYVSLKYPVETINEVVIKEFNEYAMKLSSGLSSAGLWLKRANVTDYLALVRLVTHIYDDPDHRYDEQSSISDQVFYAGDEINIERDHLNFKTGSSDEKNFTAMCLSPKYFPKQASISIMNYVLGDPKGITNQITDPYMAVISMTYPEQVEKKAQIQKKGGWIKHQLFGGSTAKFIPVLAHKNAGFETLQTEIETNSAVLVETSFAIWFFSKNRDRAFKCVEESRTYLASLGFDMRSDRLILDALFSQHLPMNQTKEGMVGLFRTHTLTASQSAQFLPLMSEWKGTRSKSVLLSTRRGELGGIDFFESDTNFNAVIVAASGAGKSFLTQRIIADYLSEGAKVWVIDQGRSYQKLCAAVGGTFMEFSPHSDICLNPFTSFLEERGGGMKSIDDEMDFLCSLIERMAAQRETLNDLELETIKKAIRQTFIEHQGHSTIRHVADWLQAQADDPRAQDLALRLDSFSRGQYSKIFNGHSNVDMGNDMVVLELDDLKSQKQLQQVVLLQLVAQISHEMYLSGGRKKILIMDEAWSLLDDPIMAKAMETAYRTARKHNGAIITVTQGIADLYKSRNSQAMIENAAWQLILQQKAEAIDDVVENGLLKIEPYYHHMLKTVNTVKGSHSEVFISRGSTVYGIFRLTVDKFTQTLFSTDGQERSKIMAELEAGVPVIEAIQRYIIGDNRAALVEQAEHLFATLLNEGVTRIEVQQMLIAALKRAEKADPVIG